MKTALFISLVLVGFAASAQKLPSVQTESVLAPANIKIDGKATEWANKFQAYNNHVEFFYTLSNDGSNLYLTVQAVQPDIIRRIMNGGITLSVNNGGKKSDKSGIAITFPLFESNNRFSGRLNAVMPSSITVSNGVVTRSESKPLTPEETDSLMNVNNANFNTKAKVIGLHGIKGLDSLISVYNEDGIKAAGAFDNKFVFTCELAVPLKHLGLDLKSLSNFTYHIQINAVEQKGISIPNEYSADPLARMKGIVVGANAAPGQPATDFWGEYILAKKQ